MLDSLISMSWKRFWAPYVATLEALLGVFCLNAGSASGRIKLTSRTAFCSNVRAENISKNNSFALAYVNKISLAQAEDLNKASQKANKRHRGMTQAPSGTTISGEHLGRIMLRHLSECNHLTFAGTCMENVHSNNVAFFAAVMSETRRLNQQVVKQALQHAYPGTQTYQKKQVIKLLPAALSALNTKRRQIKNGERVPEFYLRILGQGTPREPSRSPSSSPRSSQKQTEGSIEALYGLTSRDTPAMCHHSSTTSLSDSSAGDSPGPMIVSSQEAPCSQGQPPLNSLPCWWNASAQTFELFDPGTGESVFAEAKFGTDGFLVAHWPDGTLKHTDVSNNAKAQVCGPDVIKLKHRPAAAANLGPKRPATANLKRPAAAVKRPATAEKKASAAADTQTPGQQHEQASSQVYVSTQTKIETPSFGTVRKHVGQEKAYIQCFDVQTGTWKAIVNITAACCNSKHERVCDQLMQYCLASVGISKEDVVKQKQAIVSAVDVC
jgi:hypothetical protein